MQHGVNTGHDFSYLAQFLGRPLFTHSGGIRNVFDVHPAGSQAWIEAGARNAPA
jgi:hypothetical protein